MGLFFSVLKVAGLFRVNPKDEEEGLDNSFHGGSAYGGSDDDKGPTYAKVCSSEPPSKGGECCNTKAGTSHSQIRTPNAMLKMIVRLPWQHTEIRL